MMKEDARLEVIKLWHVWQGVHPDPERRPDAADGAEFFDYIAAEEPYLLQFGTPSQQRPVVRGWLLQARLLSD